MKLNPIFIFSMVFVLSACSSESSKTAVKKEYNESFRKTFVKEGVESCIKSSGLSENEARKFCECAMNKLNESLTNEEIINMSKGKDPEDMGERMDKAVVQCYGQLG